MVQWPAEVGGGKAESKKSMGLRNFQNGSVTGFGIDISFISRITESAF